MSDYINDTIEAGALRMAVEPLGGQCYQVSVTSADRTSVWGTWSEPITMQPDYPAPMLGQVLYFTAGRLQAVEDTDDFLGWCTETDREPGDPDALRRYRDLVSLRDQVRGTMGVDAYEGLLAGYAIDQAMSRARASFNRGRSDRRAGN
ncbi:MAG: hypothetical protein AAF624_14275 [Bacteroidota bacterium]